MFDFLIIGGGLLGLLTAKELQQAGARSEEHTSELQSRSDIVCRLLLEQKQTAELR